MHESTASISIDWVLPESRLPTCSWKLHAVSTCPPRAAVFEDATAGVEAAHAGGFGLVIGVGSIARALELLEHGADNVMADLGEVQLEGTVTSPRGA